MKLLFDQNLSHRLVGQLAVEFPGSLHSGMQGWPLHLIQWYGPTRSARVSGARRNARPKVSTSPVNGAQRHVVFCPVIRKPIARKMRTASVPGLSHPGIQSRRHHDSRANMLELPKLP